MHFDLQDTRETEFWRTECVIKAGFAMGALACVAFAAYLPVSHLLRNGSLSGWSGDESAAVIAVLLLGAAIGYNVFGRSATGLGIEVDEKGFDYHYRNSKVWRIRWESPGVKLFVFTQDAKGGKQPQGPMSAYVAAPGHSPTRNLLTPGAVQAIVESASESGLRATEQGTPESGWRRRVISNA